MPFQTKCLWAEFITTSSVQRVKDHVTATGANMLCLRTETPCFEDLMSYMKQQGVKVYGWRWPDARPANGNPDDSGYALNEMANVVKLIGKGLDGYIFDIETNENGLSDDWGGGGPANRADIATQMVAGIVDAFNRRGTPYLVGFTGHQRAFSNYPDIPYKPFLDYCNALFPQTYWRVDDGDHGLKKCLLSADDYSVHPPRPIGTPAQAMSNGFTDYANKKDRNGNVLPIIPIGGEIGCTKHGEMTSFAQLVSQRGLNEIHFYVDVDKPGWIDDAHPNDPSVLAEIKAL
jgi:hypothetical protein